MRSGGRLYAVNLDGDWSLEDLYVFPRTFEQVYFFVYSLLADVGDGDEERIRHTYASFPWQGGYSAVNFYNNLKYAVRRPNRPQIESIRYGSPGVLELGLLVSVALNVGQLVKHVCRSLERANTTYTKIIKGMQDRKLLRIKTEQEILRLSAEDLRYVRKNIASLGEVIGLASLEKIEELTEHPYRTLKILLSFYRRLRTLAEYENSGKADFPSNSNPTLLEGASPQRGRTKKKRQPKPPSPRISKKSKRKTKNPS